MITNPPVARLFSRENLPRIGAAVFSGAVLKLVSPPIGLDFIHWLTFVPLFVAVAVPGEAPIEGSDVAIGRFRGRGARLRLVMKSRNFRLGYLTGFSALFLLFFWLGQTVHVFGEIPLVFASLIVVIFASVFGLPYGFLAAAIAPLRRILGGWWVFAFPTIWVTMEFAQPALFPYYQGVGQYRNPYTWQLASVFGAYGVSWLIILTNSAAAEAWLAWRTKRPLPIVPLAITAALFLGNLGFGYWRFNAVEAALQAAPTAKVSLLQQGVTMVQRIQDRGPEVLKSWLTLTAKVAEDHPDLVVWPEGSIYYNPTEASVKKGFGQMTKQYGFAFLLGGGTHGPAPEDPTQRANWNSAYLFGTDGEIKGRYDKMVPMPFGEYLPWPVSYLKAYIHGVGSFRPGTDPTVFHTEKFSFTVPICYEAILESQMRTLNTGDVYVNITNDGWFGDTAAPHQHAMLAAAYAVEMGRPMVRIAYTGISMVVEPHGVIKYETAPYTDVAELVELRLAKFETPYRTWGRAFPYVCTVLTLLMSLGMALGVVTPRTPRA